ncbi:MAG TPA: dihydrodipicolinate synthase family protein [Desulfobacterales bacterium]|nr:dihydrodipicolinate synthase family protein [Desulfobacterales bacterium]
MGKLILTGSFVALITPFEEDGSVDTEGFGRLIDFQARHGTSALLIMGSTGEVSLLSREERHRVIAETVKFKKPGMPLFYGCTANTTRETIAMVDYAARAGADGAVVTVPSYIYAPVDAAVQYFLEVADASPIPIGIYNNPIRVGTDLPADAILRLADHPNIVIDKEAMARPGQIAQILAAGRELSLMCCDSPHLGLVPAVMALGGHGTANMTGNIAPAEMAVISRPWRTHADAVNFRETYLRLLPLIQFTYSKVNPVPVKSLARVLGLPAGRLRKPYLNMAGGALRGGLEIVKRLGLVEEYGFDIREDLIGEDSLEAPAQASASTGSSACFVR